MVVTLDLAGKESLNGYVKSLISESDGLGVRDQVVYHGFLSKAQVIELQAKASIGLVPHLPGFGNNLAAWPVKMFEFMAMGLPLVYSNIPNHLEIVGGIEVGIAVDPSKPEAIADGIARLANDHDLIRKMGQNGWQAVRDRFNWGVRAPSCSDSTARFWGQMTTGNRRLHPSRSYRPFREEPLVSGGLRMCGINGFAGEFRPTGGALLSRMIGAIAHHGPDGEGIYVDPAGSATVCTVMFGCHRPKPRFYRLDTLCGKAPKFRRFCWRKNVGKGESHGPKSVKPSPPCISLLWDDAVRLGLRCRAVGNHLTPGGANSSALMGTNQIYVDAASTTANGFAIKAGRGALGSPMQYKWHYHVDG